VFYLTLTKPNNIMVLIMATALKQIDINLATIYAQVQSTLFPLIVSCGIVWHVACGSFNWQL